MAAAHMNPAEAVRVHVEVGARKSIAMHWGTFQMTDEGGMSRLRALAEALRPGGDRPTDFSALADRRSSVAASIPLAESPGGVELPAPGGCRTSIYSVVNGCRFYPISPQTHACAFLTGEPSNHDYSQAYRLHRPCGRGCCISGGGGRGELLAGQRPAAGSRRLDAVAGPAAGPSLFRAPLRRPIRAVRPDFARSMST